MTDLPNLRGSGRALILLLALGLTAILAVSLIERFKNPHLTVQLAPTPSGMGSAAQPDRIGTLMQQAAQNPDNVGVLVQLIEALMARQNWEAAGAFARRAVTLDVSNPRPLYLLGLVEHNQGRHKEAAEILEKVLLLKDEASVRYSLGVLYIYYLKDVPRGVEHLSAGLHDPDAREELKRGLREELEKAPLPGNQPDSAQSPADGGAAPAANGKKDAPGAKPR